MTNNLIEIRSIHKAMRLLGTDNEIAEMFGTTTRAVNNWRNQDFIPAKTAFRVQFELNKIGFYVAPALLGQIGCEGIRISTVSK